MRTALLLIVAVGCVSACAPLPSEQRPSPSTPVVVSRLPGDPVRMSALTFADASHGWLIGFFGHPGTLQRTHDGGETWAAVGYPSGVQLEMVGFIDAEHGFASGWLVADPSGCNGAAGSPRCRSAVYRTDDGGVTWSPILVRAGIGAVSAITSDLLFATVMAAGCGNAYPDACGAEIVRSDDGGTTWTVLWTSPTQIWDLQFADADLGYAVRLAANGLAGKAQIMRTSDGGTTWNAILEFEHSRIPTIEVSHRHVWVVALPDDLCGMGGCSGYVLWRLDDGRSWVRPTDDPAWYIHPAPERPSFLGTPRFADAENGWLLTGVGAGVSSAGVLHTEDGGTTWRRWTVPSDLWDITALAPIDGQRAVIIATEFGTQHAHLMRTLDGGATWRRLSFEP